MQYLLSVIHDQANDATPDEQAAITVLDDRMRADGNWVFAGGLAEPTTSTVIDNRDGTPIFTDGPFVETKEFIAGLWIIEAPDLDAALALAAEGSKACNRRLEVRPFL
ncbi:YciI family protein [Flindersiella endophytica]